MKIDYCCGGNRTLDSACSEAGADIVKVLRKLDQVMTVKDRDTGHVQRMPPDELCEYIIKTHHNYVRDRIPVMTVSIDKLCNVHGKKHAELFEVKEFFRTASANLMEHMQKEELILFPYIRHMAFCGRQNTVLKSPAFGSVINPIQMMSWIMIMKVSVSGRFTKSQMHIHCQEMHAIHSGPPTLC